MILIKQYNDHLQTHSYTAEASELVQQAWHLPGQYFRELNQNLALYVHTIMIFLASHDPNGARNRIIDCG